MNPTDCGDLLAKLDAGHQELLASVQGLSDAEALTRPAEDRWSAIGNIEHLAIVESRMLQRIQEADAVEGDPPAGREAQLFEQVKNRTGKRQAPPVAHPTGNCQTLAEALEKFQSARTRTLEFLQDNERDLRRCMTEHPVFGKITGFDCVHMIAAHTFRHAAQIRELRETSR